MAMSQQPGLIPSSQPHRNCPTLHSPFKLRSLSALIPSSSFTRLFVSNSYPILTTPDQDVAAIVFGGNGPESRLYPLTKRRSEGAIPIAAKYRLVDCVVSNCIHSNISKIYALTQFNSTSLNSHLCRAYAAHDGLVQVIAAYQSPDHGNRWFQGNADAVRRCMWLVAEEQPFREFLLLPGHHLYRMDYRQLIKAHRDGHADITIAASSAATVTHDPGFGFLDLDPQNQVMAFRFKSQGKWIHVASSLPGKGIQRHSSLPSMGIYAMNKDVMKKLVEEEFGEENDFASQVIPGAVSMGMKVQAFVFGGQWEDMRSIGAFYQANMESTYMREVGASGVFTLPRSLPPTIVTDKAQIRDSIVGDGCIIGMCRIKGSVIGLGSRVGDGVVIEDSLIFGSDMHLQAQAEEDVGVSIPIGIGQHTQIRKAIVDKNARIGKNVMIINKDKVEEGDGEAEGYQYVIRDGIVILLPNAVIPDATLL